MNKLFFLLLCLFSFFCFSQNETSNWVFGRKANLKFPVIPTATPSISLNSRLIAKSSSSCISNKNGDLLLYSDGVVVWNKHHKVLPNGALLFGDNEMTQQSIIIPKPDNNSIYYLFTVKTILDVGPPDIPVPVINPGLYYTIIDISINDGTIIIKNEKLLDFEVGRITAVHHKDGKSIWVTTSGKEDASDSFLSFYSFKIDQTGINPPVVTNNLKYNGDFDGYLKFSPNGKKIASSNLKKDLLIFDFDNETGVISNKQRLIKSLVFFDEPGVYGLEFSNDSNFLYTTSYDESTSIETLYQYDLTSLHPTERISTISTTIQPSYSSLQLNNYGKIYKSQIGQSSPFFGDYLSIINSPDKIGTECNFIENAISIENSSNKGLPNFIQSYFRTRILGNSGCVNTPLELKVDTYANITAINWDFGDGNTASNITPTHTYLSPGKYNIKAIITINDRQITTFKEVIIYPLPELKENQKLIQCDVNNDGIDYFNLFTIDYKISSRDNNLTYYFYENQKDAEQDSNRITNPESYQNKTNPQTIYVRAINLNDCYSIGSFNIESSFVNIDDIHPITVCENSDNINNDGFASFNLNKKKEEIRLQLNLSNSDSLNFYSSLEDAQTTNNKLEDLFVSKNTQIWLRVDNSIGCGGIKPINLIVNHPQINLQDNYTICISPSDHPAIILNADSSNDRFEWKDESNNTISTSNSFPLTKEGEFSLTVYKTVNGIECSNSKNFTVNYPPPPEVLNIEVNIQSETDNSVYIRIDGDSSYEFSLDDANYIGNGTSHSFNNVQPGIATIYIRDINKCESPTKASASIIGYPKFLTPNADGFNDYWKVYGVSSNFFKEIDIKIFNRFGKILYIINDKNSEFGWDGTYNNIKLPSNDYWFHAKLKDLNDNTIDKKGHFTLKRN
ncbi:T9SS type B sorting domain-containing protein [Tenacibaculum singaporense]|uniref:T9SS type B sorting domain-containing protein n=1 Tax=Tenacibaculum singaporense TaxID=2358479 RepID=UPI000F687A66|nr:T9SS type B sorting domain-containing protein [Tenacibaculum singaporense]RSC94027.1 PKD domain-containing protein [Tenacibaculum singaporense]